MKNYSTESNKGDISELSKVLVLIESLERASHGSHELLPKYLQSLTMLGRFQPSFLKFFSTRGADILSSRNVGSQYSDDDTSLHKLLEIAQKEVQTLFQTHPNLQALASYTMGREYLRSDLGTYSSSDAEKSSFYKRKIFSSIIRFQESQWDVYPLPYKDNISEAIRMWDVTLSSSNPFYVSGYSLQDPEYIEFALRDIPKERLNMTGLWAFCSACIKLEYYGVPPFLTRTYEGVRRTLTFLDFLRSIHAGLKNTGIRMHFSGKPLEHWIRQLQLKRSAVSVNLGNMAIDRQGKDMRVFGENVNEHVQIILQQAKGTWEPIFEGDELGDPCNPESIDTSNRVHELLMGFSTKKNGTIQSPLSVSIHPQDQQSP